MLAKNESNRQDAMRCSKNEYTQQGGHTGVYHDLLLLCMKKSRSPWCVGYTGTLHRLKK